MRVTSLAVTVDARLFQRFGDVRVFFGVARDLEVGADLLDIVGAGLERHFHQLVFR